MNIIKKISLLLAIVAVWFAGSCKPKPGPEPVDPKPAGPIPVVNCGPFSEGQRRLLYLDNILFLLIEKRDLSSLAEAQALRPTLVLLPERAGGSVSLDNLADNHVCQVDQKKSLFLSTKEGEEDGVKYAYTTDLGDKIIVGMLKGEKYRVYGIILPKGATSSFKFVWQQQ